MNSNKQSVKFDPKTTKQATTKNKDDFDDFYDDDDFEKASPQKSPKKQQTTTTNKTQPTSIQQTKLQQNTTNTQQKQSNTLNTKTDQQQQSQQQKQPIVDYNNIQATNNTNKYIIYKFMKKGFTSLSAEDLACTMVNPDFTLDFRKNTGEEWASQYQFKVVERLNNCKFNLQWMTKRQQNDNGFDPFFQMVKEGDIGRVVEFLRHCHAQDEVLDAVESTTKKTPLHIAAAEGHIQMCEFLLHKGAKVDSRDKLLRTPLHLACQAGHAPIVKLLLDNNADPYEKDQSGRTAVHYACCSTCVEQLTLLCEHGPDLVHMKDHSGRTALHYTVFNSHQRQLEMAIKLLNLGADVNALDLERRTPLHHAAEAGKARIIPLLVQRGATTGTRDTLKGKTPLELACSDHIKELIIVHSSPAYIPKQDDLAQGLAVEGQQMKIEPEPTDLFGQKGQTIKSNKPQINQKKPMGRVEEQKNQDDFFFESHHQQPMNQSYKQQQQPLGPVKEWEKVQDQYLPYNMRNYQDKLVNFLKRVQEFGVQSYQHVKKPYLFTGSWMEYVRSMDDLMLQINGTQPNEAVMKVFNILFPYDKPLPQGRGDELSLQGFYTGVKGQNENKDCDPDELKRRLEEEQQHQRENILKNNGVEDIQDLLDLKRQLMSLEQVNNMHQITIQEKDQKIKELLEQLNDPKRQVKQTNLMEHDQYLQLLAENSDLKSQITIMAQQLEVSASRLEELTSLMEKDEARKKKEMEDMKNYSKLQELEMLKNDLERQLLQEKERNRALRFKAGQIFLGTLEKGGSINPSGKNNKNTEGDYFLADDEALMRLLQRIEQLGEPGLQQRLRDAGEPENGSITKTQFVNFLTKIGMMPPDILSIQRIVGFYDGGQPVERLKIADIMVKIMERAGKRAQIEVETLKQLANEFKAKGYSIQDAFAHLDANESGSITAKELQDALKAMKIEIGKQVLMNILHLFDTNGDNSISLEEFEKQMSKYMGGNGRIEIPKEIDSKIIKDEMKKELIEEMKQEQKKKVNFEDFGLKPMEADEMKRKEQLIIESIKKGEMPVEMISGEIKLQFDEGVNLMSITGKAIPVIALNITNYTNEGTKQEQQLFSNPCQQFHETNNFNTAVRIPMINKDKNKIAEAIQVQYYMQSSLTEVQLAQATFVGECYLPWKQILLNNGEWLQQRVALSDPMNKCPQKVQGMVKIFAKWIPAGHEDSKFEKDGTKKEQVAANNAPAKRQQLEGSSGKLEVYLQTYTHPQPLPNTEQYLIEMSLTAPQANPQVKQPITNLNKSIARAANQNQIALADVRTLAVNDVVKDRALVLRLVNTKGTEISKTIIDASKVCYIQPGQMIMLKAQGMNIEGTQEKGTIQMKLRYLESKPSGVVDNQNKTTGSQLPPQIQQQHNTQPPQHNQVPPQAQQNHHTQPIQDHQVHPSIQQTHQTQLPQHHQEEFKKDMIKPQQTHNQGHPQPQMTQKNIQQQHHQHQKNDNMFEEVKVRGTQNMQPDEDNDFDTQEIKIGHNQQQEETGGGNQDDEFQDDFE